MSVGRHKIYSRYTKYKTTLSVVNKLTRHDVSELFNIHIIMIRNTRLHFFEINSLQYPI